MKRNFLIMISGSAAAQAITLVSLPLLGRLYTPESFGYLAAAMSMSSISSALIHGRYHMAIPVAKQPEDTIVLFWLSVFLSLVLILPVIFIATACIGSGWGAGGLASFLVTCITLTLGAALLDISSYWFSYRDRFSVIARTQSLRALLVSCCQITLAPFSVFGMVIGAVSGLWAVLLLVVRTIFRQSSDLAQLPTFMQLREIAVRYQHYPLYGVPQGFLASSSWNLLPLILLRFEGPAFVGYYWVVYRILMAPLSLFNSSYRQVTLRALGHATPPQAHKIILPHSLALAAAGAFLTGFMVLSEDLLFPILMGPAWAEAAHIASVLSIGIAADFFKIPSICFLQSRHRQKELMSWEAGIFTFRYVPAMIAIGSGQTYLGIQFFAFGGLVGWLAFTVRILFINNSVKE